jgi:hypothetical protein
MGIPDFVFANGGTKSDWIEFHDEFLTDVPSHLKASASETWWRNNCTIRSGLKQIKDDVESKLLNKRRPKAEDTSVVRLSRITRLSRDTINHPRRQFWVNEALSEIKSKIVEKEKLVEQRSNKDKLLIANLRRSLEDQRTETARMFAEIQQKKDELDVQKKMIENYRLQLERVEKQTGKSINFSPNLNIEKK